MKKIKWTDLFIFIIGTELVGALSSLLSGDFSAFYSELAKPTLAPPGIVFPIVWAILYLLMGISAYLVYASDAEPSQKTAALTLYAMQLFVNFMWSIVFFRFKLLSAAIIVVLLLIVLVTAMIVKFRQIRPLSAYLNIPYLLWIMFAAYLNIGFAILN